MHLFTESDLSNTEHCTVRKYHSYYSDQPTLHSVIWAFLLWLIGMVFSNGTMLSLSDKYDSVNEHTQEISKSMKLHILAVWQNADEIYYATG